MRKIKNKELNNYTKFLTAFRNPKMIDGNLCIPGLPWLWIPYVPNKLQMYKRFKSFNS